MSELHVTYNGQVYSFAPGSTVRIGRSSDNDIVINDPTVSRQHGLVAWDGNGWVWRNGGQSPTFLSGQPVAQFGVGQGVDVALASPGGPVLRLQPAAAAAGQAPMGTELAGAPGATNMAGYAAAAAPAGYGAPGPGAPQQGYGQAGAPQQGYGQAGQQQGYGPPGAAPPPGMPGAPGFAGYPPGGGIPVSSLDQGSFFEILIPIKSWVHDRGFRQFSRLVIIPYALLPLIYLGLFNGSGNLTTPGWAYSLYVAFLWLFAFYYFIGPPKPSALVEGSIAVGVIIWTIAWLHIVTININDQLPAKLTLPAALVVGFNEESTKMIPVLVAALILLIGFKRKLDPRTWMLMGTVAGLTFGVVEQSIYTPAAIVGIHSAQVAQQAVGDTLLFSFRVFVDGFQHAVWAGVSGFFVGIAVNYRRRRIPMLLLGLAIPAVLHALNDWTLTIFSSVWVAVMVQALSLLLFLGYTLSASTIERRVRRNPNFRGQSIMMERFSTPEDGAAGAGAVT